MNNICTKTKQNLELTLKAGDIILSSIWRVSMDSERHNKKVDSNEPEHKGIKARNLKYLDMFAHAFSSGTLEAEAGR